MIFTYLWLDPDYLCISCFSLSLQQNQALPLTKTMEYCSNGLGTLCCCLIFFLPVRCSPSQKSKTLQFTVPWVAVHTGTCLFVWRSSFCKVLVNTEIKTYFLEPYWWGKIHFDWAPKLPLFLPQIVAIWMIWSQGRRKQVRKLSYIIQGRVNYFCLSSSTFP